MKRKSPIVFIGRIIQKIPLAFLRVFEIPFFLFRKKRPSLIILLALPRSGSTLTYQALIHSFNANYLSNLGNLLYQIPVIGNFFTRLFCGDYHSDFRSDHGFVSGICGPAEGLRFWSYWFNNGIDERRFQNREKKKHDRRVNYLIKALSVISSVKRPFITGYLGHVLEIEKLRRCFPDAVFIRLHRDPVSTALSLYNNRGEEKNRWFSVFPKECEEYIDRPPHKQVAAQVYWLNRRLFAYNGENVLDISYEELCNHPQELINKVVDFSKNRGVMLKEKSQLPSFFKLKQVDCESNPDAALLKEELNKLENEYGPML